MTYLILYCNIEVVERKYKIYAQSVQQQENHLTRFLLISIQIRDRTNFFVC